MLYTTCIYNLQNTLKKGSFGGFMKNMSKGKKIACSIIGIFILLVVSFVSYVNIRYREVDSSLRMVGYIGEKIFTVNTVDDLIAFSKKSSLHDVNLLESTEDVLVESKTIKGRDGKDIRLMIMRPKSGNTQKNAIGLLWFHGGGYALGTPELGADMLFSFVRTTNTVVVSPDYTLSVDEPYPAALYDAYDTLLWLKENATLLEINTDQIFVGGGSAGGGLTAATTLYARDLGEVKIAFQMPLYPMINSRMDLPSAIENTSFIWNSKKNAAGWKLYLGDLYMTDDIPVYASPSEETDYTNLPPTFTFVGSLDPFRDETISYAENLKKANIPIEFYLYEGAYHGFDMLPIKSDVTTLANERLLKAYQHAATNYFAPQE